MHFFTAMARLVARLSNSCSEPECILLVDEDARFRKLEADLLSNEGYSVLEASSAQEALNLAVSTRPIHLLIADFWFPTTDNAHLPRRFRELRPEVPVLMISGALPGGADSGLGSGG